MGQVIPESHPQGLKGGAFFSRPKPREYIFGPEPTQGSQPPKAADDDHPCASLDKEVYGIELPDLGQGIPDLLRVQILAYPESLIIEIDSIQENTFNLHRLENSETGSVAAIGIQGIGQKEKRLRILHHDSASLRRILFSL
jgi:hypothetical protein